MSIRISLNPDSIARLLGITAAGLIIANTATTIYITWHERGYRSFPALDIDREYNIPTVFSSLLLLLVALVLAIVTRLEKARTSSAVLYWSILSWGFLFMAIDEIGSLHERLISPIRKLLGDRSLGIFYFAWIIPAMMLIVILALFFWRFWIHLSRKIRKNLLIASILYLGGCIGCEMLGGYYAELYGFQNFGYGLIASMEEGLEMLGAIVFSWGLMTYIADEYGEIEFQFERVRAIAKPRRI
jgi:heme A synthase